MLPFTIRAWFRVQWERILDKYRPASDMPFCSYARLDHPTVEVYRTRQGFQFYQAGPDYLLLGTLPPNSSDDAIDAVIDMFHLDYDPGLYKAQYGDDPEPCGP